MIFIIEPATILKIFLTWGLSMTKNQLIAEVNDVMIEDFELKKDDLKPEARLSEDLQLDSLDAMNMLVYLEDRINIQVDLEKFKSASTLNDIYSIIHEVVSLQTIKFK